MRHRTAAILSVVLIGGMFGLQAVVQTIFLPSLEHGFPNPIPEYERILLHIASFCGLWKWLLALPIALVLFTIAEFTGPARVRARRQEHAAAESTTKRPVGVTVIAVLNILGGVALFVSGVFHGGLDGMLAVEALLSVGIGVAFLMLQNWARWFLIVGCGLSLIGIPFRVVMAHGIADALIESVYGLCLLGAIWYLYQPHVKAAFRGIVKVRSHAAR